jgi:hypothetical protein
MKKVPTNLALKTKAFPPQSLLYTRTHTHLFILKVAVFYIPCQSLLRLSFPYNFIAYDIGKQLLSNSSPSFYPESLLGGKVGRKGFHC